MRQLLISETDFKDVCIIKPFKVDDERGVFEKYYSKKLFEMNDIDFECTEHAIIKNRKGVLRGLHFQKIVKLPKLITCIDGSLCVAVVNMNQNSRNFCASLLQVIEEGESLYIPGDYAVGSLSLSNSLMHIIYGGKFSGELSVGIRWNDDKLLINWPLVLIGGDPIISDNDRNLPSISEYLKMERNTL